MYQTPLDILYLILSISVGLIALFLVLALIHFVGILRNINTVTRKAKDTVDLVNHYLWQPIKIFLMVLEKAKEMASEKRKQHED